MTYLDLAELSAAVYDADPSDLDAHTARGYLLLNGWNEITTSSILRDASVNTSKFASDGYYAEVWEDAAGDIVITNEGTKLNNVRTLLADLKIAAGAIPQAEFDAQAFATAIANRNPGKAIIETGHSLGGSEAQAATAALVDLGKNSSAVTFNAPGIATGVFKSPDPSSYNVLNFYNQGDAIHLVGGEHLGDSLVLSAGPATAKLIGLAPIAATGPLGIAALLSAALYSVLGPAHKINTVIDYLTDANPVLGQQNWTASGPVSSLPDLPAQTLNVTYSDGSLTFTDTINDFAAFTIADNNTIQNATWSTPNSSGSYDASTQSATWSNPDGSSGTVVSDSQGYTLTNFDAADNVINTSRLNTDGSGGASQLDTFGSKTESIWNADGSGEYDVYDFPDGSLSEEDIYNSDNSRSMTTYYADGTVAKMSTYEADGSGSHVVFNSHGTLLSSAVINNDGSASEIYYYSHGLVDGKVYYTSSIAPDGSRTITTYIYDNSGNQISDLVLHDTLPFAPFVPEVTTVLSDGSTSTLTYSDVWSAAFVDGEYGGWGTSVSGGWALSSAVVRSPDGVVLQSDSYNLAGQIIEETITYPQADGSSETSEREYYPYALDSRLNLGYPKIASNVVTHADGSVGRESFYFNGQTSELSITNADGSSSSRSWDVYGALSSDSWTNADGTSGSATFSAGGSGTGSSHNPDGSYSTYVSDGQGDTTTTSYDPNGNELGYSVAANDGQGRAFEANYDVAGTKLSDSWTRVDGTSGSDVFNADGSFASTVNDEFGETTTTNYASDGVKLSDNWNRADGSYGSDTYNPDGSLSEQSQYTQNGDGSWYSVSETLNPDGSWSDNWTSSDGSYGSDAHSADGSSNNTIYYADGGYVLKSSDASTGVSSEYDQYSDGSWYRSTQYPNGDNWAASDGSHGNDAFSDDGSSSGTAYNPDGSYTIYADDGQRDTVATDYDANGSKLSDDWARADGTSGSDIFNADGSTESAINYVYQDGSTYSVDTVSDPDGSYQQSWSKDDGSFGDANYVAATGETFGDISQAGAGYSYSYDNTLLGDGVTESAVTYTYDDGSIYSTDTVSDPDGSYQQSWNKGDGSYGDANYDAATGETFGDVAQAGAGYSYSYDNTLLGDGISESAVTYTYDDGSVYSTDTVSDPDGSYQQSWSKDDGSFGDANYDAATGETSGDVAQAGAGYSYAYDNTLLGGGITESAVTYTYDDGSTYATDTVNDPDGSYQQSWNKSDGSFGDANYVAATGETFGDVAQAGAGYSYSYDNTLLGGGISESAVTYTYTDGSTYATDTVSDPDGSYQQSWSKGDGSHGDANYVAATGETFGDVAQAGAGYSYSYDNTNLGSGITESAVTYTYTDGSTYATDTVSDPDGSYQQSWAKSDGSAGSVAVDATGSVVGDSWLTSAGLQGVDAGGNHLLLGVSGADTLGGGTGVELLIGGGGNDAITTGAGANLIAFNLGDGQDTVVANSGTDNTVSLGGDFAYSDLAFQKSGSDLILGLGNNDSLTFKDWYASAGDQNVANLQVIAAAMSDYAPGSADSLRNAAVETFNFQQLVGAFDQAQVGNPDLTPWALTNALLDAHLAGSDSAALGGDLTYEYGAQGNLTGFGVAAAETTLSNAQFGSAPQSLSPAGTLDTGVAQLK